MVSIFPAITKAAYDTVKDFKPINMTGVIPQILVMNATLPVGNIAAFIAFVKMQPQRLPHAGGGAAADFAKRAVKPHRRCRSGPGR